MMLPERDSPLFQPVILLIDDSHTNLSFLGDILRERYVVATALDGESGLARAEQTPRPDLILLDLMMPEMDGFEVLQRLKSAEATASIPVIIITANDKDESETRALELGAVDFIRKPFLLPVVHARIRTHIELKRARENIVRQFGEICNASTLREDIERMARQDMKTPLGVVVGLTQTLLQDQSVSSEHREKLFAVQTAGYNALNMINLSLDLYKMETGRYVLDWQIVDLALLIDRVFLEFQAEALAKRVSYLLRVKDAKPSAPLSFEVWGDGLLLYTAFSTLIKKAIDASPPDQSVTIELDKAASAGHVIRIRNGGAVPIAARSRLFQKNAVCGPGADSGLGGYAARLIVETHGGVISLDESEEGQTVVVIALPQRSGGTAT